MAGNDWLPSSTKPKKFKVQDDLKLKRMSIMAAALQVLHDRMVLMNCPETIDVMATEGLWDNPGGKTPVSTLFTVQQNGTGEV